MNHTNVIMATILITTGLLASGILSHMPGFAYAQMESSQQPQDTDNSAGQGISQGSNTQQPAYCMTVGGNSPISDSCRNAATTAMSNTGGNGAVLHGKSDIGPIAGQGISQGSNTQQPEICLTVGGNSPITGN